MSQIAVHPLPPKKLHFTLFLKVLLFLFAQLTSSKSRRTFDITVKDIREGSHLKKFHKKRQKSKRAVSVPKIKNVQNSKFGLFDSRGGGVRFFRFFPNVNVDFKCFS